MKRKKKVDFKEADIFLIPLENGEFSIGQILLDDRDELDSVVCGFSNIKADKKETATLIEVKDLIAVRYISYDLIERGVWPIIGRGNDISVEQFININDLRKSGYVGVEIIGSANIAKFMNAYFGFFPWDGHYKPDFFDEILLDYCEKPDGVIFKNIVD